MTNRPHVLATAGLVVLVVCSAAALLAPGLALLAVPFVVAVALRNSRPRAAAAVAALWSLLVLAVAGHQLVTGPEVWLDWVFDTVGTALSLIVVVDGTRTAFGERPRAAMASR